MSEQRTAQGYRFRRRSAAAIGVILGAVLLLGWGQPSRAAEDTKGASDDLLTGYDLLSGVMSSEAQMKYLLWLRQLTFQGPGAELKRLITEIYETSEKRSGELKDLRKLAPPTTAKPPPSPIGSAITDSAQWKGTKEMLFPGGEFGMRFVFLQADATRMIAVIAEETAKIDPNARRKKWLTDVAKQYETYREDLLKSVEKCALK